MKKLVLAGLGFVLVVSVAACGPSYDYAHYSYRADTPTLIGIQMTTDAPHNQCVFGIGATGAAVVGSVLAPPAGAAAWFVWGSTILGATGLADCWEQFNNNRAYFNVWTFCSGQPVLKTTFTDYNSIGPFVEMPSCVCSVGCMNNIPGANAQWQSGEGYYHDGPNRLLGPVVADPPPPDYNAMAAAMGLTYAGCDDSAVNHISLCPSGG